MHLLKLRQERYYIIFNIDLHIYIITIPLTLMTRASIIASALIIGVGIPYT